MAGHGGASTAAASDLRSGHPLQGRTALRPAGGSRLAYGLGRTRRGRDGRTRARPGTGRVVGEWRRAPSALAHHRSVLVAVFAAALLAALASSSAPFVTTAAASETLKDRLSELTSFATGVEVQCATEQLSGSESASELDAQDAALGAAASRLRLRFGHVYGAVLDASGVDPIAAAGGASGAVLMARTGALRHVAVVSEVAEPGIWLSDISAQAAGVRAGATVTVQGLTSSRGRASCGCG